MPEIHSQDLSCFSCGRLKLAGHVFLPVVGHEAGGILQQQEFAQVGAIAKRQHDFGSLA